MPPRSTVCLRPATYFTADEKEPTRTQLSGVTAVAPAFRRTRSRHRTQQHKAKDHKPDAKWPYANWPARSERPRNLHDKNGACSGGDEPSPLIRRRQCRRAEVTVKPETRQRSRLNLTTRSKHGSSTLIARASKNRHARTCPLTTRREDQHPNRCVGSDFRIILALFADHRAEEQQIKRN